MFRSGKLPETCSATAPAAAISVQATLVEFEIAEPGMVRKLAGSHHKGTQWNTGDLHTDHIADFFRRGNFRLLDKLALDLIDRHVCRHGQHKGGRLQQFCVMDIGLPDTVTQMQRQIDGSWRQYGMQRPFDFR